MKKLYLFVLMLAASLTASAEVIPMARAKAEAERFLKEMAPARSPQLKLLFEEPRMTKAGPTEPEYFIFEDAAGGYVISAGDDAVPSVLGYSTSGSFRTAGMPDNLRAWLDMWSEIVDDARLRDAAPYPVQTKGGGTSKLLETALWDQGDPFNRHCIEVDGDVSVTGCVATATAILMRYHKWPKKGKGTIPSYTFSYKGKTYTPSAITLGHTYEWDIMPLTKYANDWSEAQIEAVSVLMQELGVMVQAEYSPEGTSASTADVGPGLVKYMDYDKANIHESKALYPDVNDWVRRIKSNIDEVGPVLYRATSSEGGHAFILDGYDENDYLHINWGWSGSNNGYYVMPSFNDYTSGHGATFGLKKNAGGVAPEDLRLYNMGISASTTEFSVGVPFTVSCRSLANYGADTFVGEVAFAKFDRDGKMEELVSESNEISIDHYIVYTFTNVPCVINTPIKPGDVVKLVYRSASTPSWTEVRYDREEMIIGEIAVGDSVFLENIVALSYDASTGILTVSFSDEAGCELRRGKTAVRDGVSDKGDTVTIDAKRLAPASYTLHLYRDTQEKDITIKMGLKK